MEAYGGSLGRWANSFRCGQFCLPFLLVETQWTHPAVPEQNDLN